MLSVGSGCDGDGSGTGGSGGSGGDTGGAGGTGGSGGTGGDTGGTGGTGGSGPMPFVINFEGRVGDKVFSCADTYTGLGTSNAEAKITDFRVYVHDIELLAGGEKIPVTLEQDGVWQYENLALLDFESGDGACANGTTELHTAITGTVPEGTGPFDGIRFKVGVPFELNHADVATAPSPLNLTGLFWNWNGGYKFLRVDSVPVGAAMSFNLHLGSTECMDDGNGGVSMCNKPNRPEVELSGTSPLTTKILVDYAAAVSGADLSQNMGGAPGCMSGATDPECGPIFDHLGIDIDTGAPKAGQTMFRFETPN
ncbi:MAG: metallo-mystery pair system four-Cys motif protein [Polyangiaceae bacterium]